MIDLKREYTDLKNPAAYGGINKFYSLAKQKYPNLKRKDVKKFLEQNDAYTIHHPKRKVKKYRRIMVKGIKYQYSVDLIDLQAFSKENKGYSWLMNIIGRCILRILFFEISLIVLSISFKLI